ncbi:hypothetical protein TNCV_4820791 [Trichonephila clavipes]|nr:hypothetical protein TNCV_4820791 [Trichonephila clavipes]
MPYPGFEPTPYGTAVSVTNQYTGWVTHEYTVDSKAFQRNGTGDAEKWCADASFLQGIVTFCSLFGRRFHDDCSSSPAGQRLVKPGHRGLLAGHTAQRHLSQAEGAVPEDGPTSQSLVAGGLFLAQEQTQEPQKPPPVSVRGMKLTGSAEEKEILSSLQIRRNAFATI